MSFRENRCSKKAVPRGRICIFACTFRIYGPILVKCVTILHVILLDICAVGYSWRTFLTGVPLVTVGVLFLRAWRWLQLAYFSYGRDVGYSWRTFLTGVDFLKVKNPLSSLCNVTESAICNALIAVFIQSSC